MYQAPFKGPGYEADHQTAYLDYITHNFSTCMYLFSALHTIRYVGKVGHMIFDYPLSVGGKYMITMIYLPCLLV